jgi:16S rRNA processing protein RimM
MPRKPPETEEPPKSGESSKITPEKAQEELPIGQLSPPALPSPTSPEGRENPQTQESPGSPSKEGDPGSKLIVLGRLRKPRGIKGELNAEYYGEDPEFLKKAKKLFLLPPDYLKPQKASKKPSKSPKSPRSQAQFPKSGANDNPEEAIGSSPSPQPPAPPEPQPEPQPQPLEVKIYSIKLSPPLLIIRFDKVRDRDAAAKLVGCYLAVRRSELPQTEEDEFYLSDLIGLRVETDQGILLGTLARLAENSGNLLLEIVSPEGKEILLPFTDEFIKEISPGMGLMVISPIPGLLDDSPPHKDKPHKDKPPKDSPDKDSPDKDPPR